MKQSADLYESRNHYVYVGKKVDDVATLVSNVRAFSERIEFRSVAGLGRPQLAVRDSRG